MPQFIKDLQALVTPDRPIAVEFGKRVLDLESYVEPGMRAVLTRFRFDSDPDVCVLTVDYTPFDEFNKKFEQPNYYDKHGDPCLTAREAGQYSTTEDLFFMANDPLDGLLQLQESKTVALYTEYSGSEACAGGTSYTQWLEAQVLELRKAAS